MTTSIKERMVHAAEALPDRPDAMQFDPHHYVNGSTMVAPFRAGLEQVLLGLGCFWGAERLFWRIPGVVTTAAGYAGGFTLNATYKDVCSGLTGHTEVVLVVWDPALLSFDALLKVFWEAHDPTQGLRQGNDRGSQYRSAIYTSTPQQLLQAQASRDCYDKALAACGKGRITTELGMAVPFFYAEEYHQQYLARNPGGYCGLQGTGVPCSASSTESAA
jgi:peptide-methionine (S)-S-oxide reductase